VCNEGEHCALPAMEVTTGSEGRRVTEGGAGLNNRTAERDGCGRIATMNIAPPFTYDKSALRRHTDNHYR